MKETTYGVSVSEQVVRAKRAWHSQGTLIPMNPHRWFQSRTSLEENCVRLTEYAERLELELRCAAHTWRRFND